MADQFLEPVTVVIISGRSGVGKSSIANELHSLLSRPPHQRQHAAIEGDSLDLIFPKEPGAELFLANLQSLWQNIRERRGSACNVLLLNGSMVVTEHEEIRQVIRSASLAAAKKNRPSLAEDYEPRLCIIGIILTASDTSVLSRLVVREVGTTLGLHVESSKRVSGLLEEFYKKHTGSPSGNSNSCWTGINLERVSTDEKSVNEVAEEIIRRVWKT